jgi:hypothetical protein
LSNHGIHYYLEQEKDELIRNIEGKRDR